MEKKFTPNGAGICGIKILICLLLFGVVFASCKQENQNTEGAPESSQGAEVTLAAYIDPTVLPDISGEVKAPTQKPLPYLAFRQELKEKYPAISGESLSLSTKEAAAEYEDDSFLYAMGNVINGGYVCEGMGRIYYVDINGSGNLYCRAVEGGEKTVIFEGKAENLLYDQGKVYFKNAEDSIIYFFNVDGEGKFKIKSLYDIDCTDFILGGGCLFARNNEGILKLSLSDGEKSMLYHTEEDKLNTFGMALYGDYLLLDVVRLSVPDTIKYPNLLAINVNTAEVFYFLEGAYLPVIMSHSLFYQSSDGSLTEYNLTNDTVKEFEYNGGIVYAQNPVGANERVYYKFKCDMKEEESGVWKTFNVIAGCDMLDKDNDETLFGEIIYASETPDLLSADSISSMCATKSYLFWKESVGTKDSRGIVLYFYNYETGEIGKW